MPGDDIGCLIDSSKAAAKVYAASDSVIENTHYRTKWLTPRQIAYRLFARNWSDFLCKGIFPHSALLNLALRREHATHEFLAPFLKELDTLFTKHKICLVGGDTARSEVDTFTLVFLGSQGKFIPRKNKTVRAGDALVQLGSVGGSDFSRHILENKLPHDKNKLKGFLKPRIFPNLPQRTHLKATIDQSDSLEKSLRLLAHANAAILEVELSDVFVESRFKVWKIGAPHEILTAAEDLAVFAIAAPSLMQAQTKQSVAFRPIGIIKAIRVENPHVVYLWHGRELSTTAHGFEHF